MKKIALFYLIVSLYSCQKIEYIDEYNCEEVQKVTYLLNDDLDINNLSTIKTLNTNSTLIQTINIGYGLYIQVNPKFYPNFKTLITGAYNTNFELYNIGIRGITSNFRAYENQIVTIDDSNYSTEKILIFTICKVNLKDISGTYNDAKLYAKFKLKLIP